ncbi:MAG: EamA family transporter [Patescibacteria group bacterium]|jgi:drug/metabolite transporter (DMT)-like permease
MSAALLPLISVVADAIYLTATKVFLRRYGRYTGREFLWFLFVSIVIVLAVIMPFVWNFPPWEVVKQTLPWWGGVVLLACLHNSLFYWGLEHEKISDAEPLLLLSPLAGIMMASLFYPSERFVQVYIAVIVATVVLLWSHYKKHRIAFSEGLTAIIAFIVVNALELVFLKRLLEYYDPLPLYFIRCIFVLIGLTFIIRPRLSLLKVHHLPFFGLQGVLVVLSVWASYTTFQLRGISETLFVFTLSPILLYWLSAIFLKEKWQIKNIIASIIIIGLVVWVTLLK